MSLNVQIFVYPQMANCYSIITFVLKYLKQIYQYLKLDEFWKFNSSHWKSRNALGDYVQQMSKIIQSNGYFFRSHFRFVRLHRVFSIRAFYSIWHVFFSRAERLSKGVQLISWGWGVLSRLWRPEGRLSGLGDRGWGRDSFLTLGFR